MVNIVEQLDLLLLGIGLLAGDFGELATSLPCCEEGDLLQRDVVFEALADHCVLLKLSEEGLECLSQQ